LTALGLTLPSDLDLRAPVSALDPSSVLSWDEGSTYIIDYLAFLVLDDVANHETDIAALLTPVEGARQAVRYGAWGLEGDARQAWLETDVYDIEEARPQEVVFPPIATALCTALQKKL
jgi:hypothetical protein